MYNWRWGNTWGNSRRAALPQAFCVTLPLPTYRTVFTFASSALAAIGRQPPQNNAPLTCAAKPAAHPGPVDR